MAGVRKLVLIADGIEKLKKAEYVLGSLPFKYEKVSYYKDAGLGSIGLPFHARHLLDNNFFFDFGHSLAKPEHYQKMDKVMQNGNQIVMSLFKPDYERACPSAILCGKKIEISEKIKSKNCFYIDNPYLLNKKYVNLLPKFKFLRYGIINYFLSNDLIRFVKNDLPIEVDIIEEWEKAVPIYQSYVKKLAKRAKELSI